MDYRTLKDELDEFTKFHSSSNKCLNHPNFPILCNRKFIPKLKEDLEQGIGVHNCFQILYQIFQKSPIKPENLGKVKEMTDDWLNFLKD